MGSEKPDREPLFVCRYKGSPSRYTATYSLEDLKVLVDKLFPLDEVYEYSPTNEGEVILRKLGSFKVDFVPLEASVGQSPPEVAPAEGGSFLRKLFRKILH